MIKIELTREEVLILIRLTQERGDWTGDALAVRCQDLETKLRGAIQ